MITAPFFIVVLLIVLAGLKTKSVRGGSVFLGLVLGLCLASTSFGAPILNAVTSMSSALFGSLQGLGKV